MSVYVPTRVVLTSPGKAILGPGAAAMQTLQPLYGAIRNPQQQMRMAQLLFHTDRWVYKAEQTIDFAFSTVDWHLEDGDDNEIDASASGPLLDAFNLMEKPQALLGGDYATQGLNRQGLTRQQLWSLTARHMGLCGSSFWLLDQMDGLAKTPLAVLYINPARMTPAEDDHGNLTGWVLDYKDDYGYQQNSGYPLRLDEVLHFKLNEPDTGHFGIGNVEAAWTASQLTRISDQHAIDVLDAGGRLAGIVSAKQGGTIPDNLYQQLVRDLRTINDEPQSARKTIVVQGPIDFLKTAATPAELDLLRLMTMSRDDTLAVWGVPLSQIASISGTGLNSGESHKIENQAFWQHAVHPRLIGFWEVLQFNLLDRYQKLGAVVDLELEEPEFEDLGPRYDLLQKSAGISMTEAERRAQIGLDPFGVPELDDAIYLPVGLVMVGQAPNSGPPPSPTGEALGSATPQAADTPDEAATAAGETNTTGTTSGKARISPRFAPLRASLLKLRANIDKASTPALRKSVASVLAAQRKEIADRVRGLPVYRLKDPAHLFPKSSQKDWDAKLHAALAPHLTRTAETVSKHIGQTLKPTGKAGAVGAVERALTRGAARVTRINQTTRDRIAEIVAQGADQGLSPADLGDAVAAWSGWDEYRSELIARTELMDAYNGAALASYAEADVTQVQAIDGDGDEECAARDGEIYDVEEADTIEDHPNGTLDWVPILPDEGKAAEVHETVGNPHEITAATEPSRLQIEVMRSENQPAPIVNVPAPIVNVSPPDISPFTDAIYELRSMLQKPRTRRVIRDETGRVTGIEEE